MLMLTGVRMFMILHIFFGLSNSLKSYIEMHFMMSVVKRLNIYFAYIYIIYHFYL